MTFGKSPNIFINQQNDLNPTLSADFHCEFSKYLLSLRPEVLPNTVRKKHITNGVSNVSVWSLINLALLLVVPNPSSRKTDGLLLLFLLIFGCLFAYCLGTTHAAKIHQRRAPCLVLLLDARCHSHCGARAAGANTILFLTQTPD